MTLPTIELEFLIDSLSLHDSKSELCVESQEGDHTYLMSVPACSILDTADVVKSLATQRIADAKRIAELEAALRKCIPMIDELVKESGRCVEYGEEDSFRRGEWFEPDQIQAFTEAKATLEATP
jgi:hypothetical protein